MRKTKIELNTVLYESWGYDQTNVTFWLVTDFTKSRKSVKITKIPAKRVGETSHFSDKVVPDMDNIYLNPKTITKRIIRDKKQEEFIKMTDYSHADIWQGDPVHRSWGH